VSLAARWLVVVDALNGAILTAFNQVASANVRGTGADVFGVTRPLDVWREGNTYFMVDTSKPMFDPASDPPSPDKIRGGIVVLDANNQRPDAEGSLALSLVTASSPTAWAVPDAVSASFALSQTYDYFRSGMGASPSMAIVAPFLASCASIVSTRTRSGTAPRWCSGTPTRTPARWTLWGTS